MRSAFVPPFILAAAFAALLLLVAAALTVIAMRKCVAPHLLLLVSSKAELASQPGLDAYFASMTPCDVEARSPLGCADAAGYVACLLPAGSIGGAAVDALRVDIADAESAMRIAGFPEAMLSPQLGSWRVAVLSDRAEGGWPHTHGDVICLPASMVRGKGGRARVHTLVHERVHVFQRAHPDAVAHLVQGEWRMRPRPLSLIVPSVARRRRSNPDLDGSLYYTGEDEATSVVAAAAVTLFRSEADARNGGLAAGRTCLVGLGGTELPPSDRMPQPAYEHPYEAMAYLLAEVAVPMESIDAERSSELMAGIRRWMMSYS